MNKPEVLHLYDEQERKNSTHPSYQREAVPGIVRHVSADSSRLSFIIYSDLTEVNADQIIREQITWYKETVNGAGLEWKTYGHDTPPDLPQRLIACGFEPENKEGLLVLDRHECPPGSQFAGLWGGATRAEYRQMGLYTAVVAARVQEAIRRGYRFLTVDASDMSRPILEKRGFQLLTYTMPFTWKK